MTARLSPTFHPTRRSSLRPGGAALRCGLILLALAILPTGLHATTYLFSFTGSQVLTALGSTDPNESTSGYFAIMVQPNINFSQQVTWGPINAPATPQPSETWTTSTITDFTDLGNSNPFVTFSKAQVQSNVAVLTNDANFVFDMQGTLYHDNLTWPVGWGSNAGTIQDEINPAGTFTFVLTTSQVLGSSVTLTGRADSYFSQDNKTDVDIPFTLTATVTPVTSTPEPETWGLMATGFLLFALGLGSKHIRRPKRQ